MHALKIQTTLSEIEQAMAKIAPHRNFALFEKFLVQGYAAVTLDSVPEALFDDMLRAKLCLGTLITLYDDFADRPEQVNAPLLDLLYRLRFGKRPPLRSTTDSLRPDVLDFANSLFVQIEEVLRSLSNYELFLELLNFDLSQFYSANQYASLVTANPDLNNQLENRLYAHHNMGMVIVAMMDLMASEKVNLKELGPMREVFLIGQRMGRIFNVLTTSKRESLDGDITGELATCKDEKDLRNRERKLRIEILSLRKQLAALDISITTFSVKSYLQGLMDVQNLHQKMEGVI